MKFKLVEVYNHVNRDNLSQKLDYRVLKEGSLKEIDKFTTKYDNSDEIRLYYNLVKNPDYYSGIVIVHENEYKKEQKMKVLYKKEKQDLSSNKLKTKVFNYIKHKTDEEELIAKNNNLYNYEEKSLHLLKKYPFFFGGDFKYGLDTFSYRTNVGSGRNSTKPQRELFKDIKRYYYRLTSRINNRGKMENLFYGETRQAAKLKLVNQMERFTTSILRTNPDYAYYGLRRINSYLEKDKDYIKYNEGETMVNNKEKPVKNLVVSDHVDLEKDYELNDPFYFHSQGDGERNYHGDCDYEKILEEEERAHKNAMKQYTKKLK